MKVKDSFVLDTESIKDAIYDLDDIHSYFTFIIKEDGTLLIHYASEDYARLVYNLDSLLFDVKLQLNADLQKRYKRNQSSLDSDDDIEDDD